MKPNFQTVAAKVGTGLAYQVCRNDKPDFATLSFKDKLAVYYASSSQEQHRLLHEMWNEMCEDEPRTFGKGALLWFLWETRGDLETNIEIFGAFMNAKPSFKELKLALEKVFNQDEKAEIADMMFEKAKTVPQIWDVYNAAVLRKFQKEPGDSYEPTEESIREYQNFQRKVLAKVVEKATTYDEIWEAAGKLLFKDELEETLFEKFRKLTIPFGRLYEMRCNARSNRRFKEYVEEQMEVVQPTVKDILQTFKLRTILQGMDALLAGAILNGSFNVAELTTIYRESHRFWTMVDNAVIHQLRILLRLY